jgi:hypothetical protein
VVDDAHHGRRQADTQRERENRNDRERGRPPQSAQKVSDVLSYLIEELEPGGASCLLFVVREASESTTSATRVWSVARGGVVRRVKVEVKSKLFLEIALVSRSSE